MSIAPAARYSKELGTTGDWRRRLVFHHAPLALASAVVLLVFMSLPSFDPRSYPQTSMGPGVLPQAVPQQAGVDRGQQSSDEGRRLRVFKSRFTIATGYVATGLLGLTLLIGPANLLLRRRNPVSSSLRRDVGTWTAIFSVVHVILGLELHSGGQVPAMLAYVFAPGGSPLTTSFGLGNWTGLAALVIVLLLLALSTDGALRELKARTWKDLQRLNYPLFALVVLHAFFYGALLRPESPFTLLLLLGVSAVLIGQAVGIRLWRRRSSRATARLA